ncbi:MAG: DNA cytosine methyltransferase [Thermodesulfobacteriota bacterium]
MHDSGIPHEAGSGIPVLSFFTGGGFLDMGFEQAGFRVFWTNEVNEVFASMYSRGMTSWRRALNPGSKEAEISNKKSITGVTAPKILREAFSRGRPGFFGIIGGPPCPDFSDGGKHGGGKGINGRLSRVFVNRICKIKPSFFVFENVRGLYKTRIHRDYLSELEKLLESRGFVIDLKVLNALEFGVPQDRERLIMIGVQKALAEKCVARPLENRAREWFPWPKPDYPGAKNKFKWPGKEERGGKPRKPRGLPSDLTVSHHFTENGPISEKPNGKDFFKPHSEKFRTVCEGDANRKSFKRLHRYRYSPTACYGHNEVHLHPWENRRLSVREAMRVQGIPDEYVLPEDASLSSKFTLVANGVPVPLAHAVAVSLREFFEAGNLPIYSPTTSTC